jgi:hypothetical protein
MTTYGIQLKDQNSSFEILWDPARPNGDRVGLVIQSITYWMSAQHALTLQRHLDNILNSLSPNSPAIHLGSHGISASVTANDAKALSSFLKKVEQIISDW